MGRQDRLTWISRGSPFTLMRPAKALRDKLRAHGYTVYDIGNRQHLEHEPPEDHTPYSETGWPGKARYGVGYAIDIMPPKAGARSKLTGRPLPSLQQLGARMVADRKANLPGIRWLKYQNWEPERNNGGPCYQDSWKPNYRRRASGDRGHIHMSGVTGYETSSIGDGYDPVARIQGREDDMSEQDVTNALNTTPTGWQSAGVGQLATDMGMGPKSTRVLIEMGWEQSVLARAEVTALRGVVETLAETIRDGGGSVDTVAILAGVDERLERLAAETRDAVADLGEGGAAQVRADAPESQARG
ncbi:hypothetical protein ABNF97_09435 [Plantactinospora sp. B6F1]|uniref:hypothetical protein n=1 Tax=Plantactinospora sp. B6F1 TaxID=3158971 RepID=UPI0032D9755C